MPELDLGGEDSKLGLVVPVLEAVLVEPDLVGGLLLGVGIVIALVATLRAPWLNIV